MIPKTAEELVRLLTASAQMRLYIDITQAAKMHRLDEAEIAQIERDLLVEIGTARAAIHEFPFDAGKAILQAEAILTEMFNTAHQARLSDKVQKR